ncbi:hypothetical protein ACIO7M_12475 [Streptomyces toxytricini]|uniref:Uncharacterized protein n=1 Tax=Streptomyces toxytricini TaxID=67369 RepID=A0ABW8EF98_STRT5
MDAPEAGMVWEPGEEAREAKLVGFRSYRRATCRPAPRPVGEDQMAPIGQYTATLRRTGAENALGKDEDTAATRGAQLAATGQDWNCPWPLEWQRHHRVLAGLADADGHLPDIAPAFSWAATTSAGGSSRRSSRPPARVSCPSGRSG